MKIIISFAPKIDDSIVTHDGKIKINFAPSEINKKEIKMKYEVIKLIPGLEYIKIGYTIKHELMSLAGKTQRYHYTVFNDNVFMFSTYLDFNPADYPEFFKRIEEKWIDYTIHFLSESEEGLKPILIKPHRYNLYTKDDIADFTACYISTKFPIPIDRFNKEDFNIIFDAWLNKKLQS